MKAATRAALKTTISKNIEVALPTLKPEILSRAQYEAMGRSYASKGISAQGSSWNYAPGAYQNVDRYAAEYAATIRPNRSFGNQGNVSPVSAVINDPIKATATGALGISYAYDQIAFLPIRWVNTNSGEEVDVDPPIWFESPRRDKPHIDQFYLIASAAEQSITRGEFAWYLWRNNDGSVSEVQPIDTYHLMQNIHSDGRTTYQVLESADHPDIPTGPIDSTNLLHVITNPVPGRERGVSPIQCNEHSIVAAIMSEMFGLNWYRRSPKPGLVMHSGKFANDEDESEMLETVQDRFADADSDFSVVMIESQDVKIEAFDINPADAQLAESQDAASKKIGKLLRLGKALQGEDTGTMTKDAVVGQQQHYAASMAMPLMSKICAGMKRICPTGVQPKPDWSGILEGDEATRHEMFRKDLMAGAISPNTFARLTGREEIDEEWANENWITGNMVPMSDLSKQAKKAAEEPEPDPTPQMMPIDPLNSRAPQNEDVEEPNNGNA